MNPSNGFEMTKRVAARSGLAALCLALPGLAQAHGGEIHPGQSLWHWSPEILIGLGLAGAVYARGALRGPRPPAGLAFAFYAGLLALFIALISPVERLADHIFAVHQVEHMLLRTIGPLLLFLSMPQAVLMRGLPQAVRKRLTGPVASTGAVRSFIGFLRKPLVATLLFLASSYVWMMPAWHDLAILDTPIHYLWHVSLLISGLIFFSVVFDPRSTGDAVSIGGRLGMVVAAALGNIVLGAFLTFKTVSIYSAYRIIGHGWNVPMVFDEQTGGAIMWIPGTMMFAMSALIMIHRWSRQEERSVDRRRRDNRPLRTASSAKANNALALGLAGFALVMLMAAVVIAIVIHHTEAAGTMIIP